MSELEPCPYCQEPLCPSEVQTVGYYTWTCGHQAHLNCFANLFVGHFDEVIMKRRNKTIDPVHDKILACPKCRQGFDSVRGIVETKALMTRHGYTLQSIRAWIRNDRYRAEQHQNAATSIAPPIAGPVYVPQWVLVLCCRNLQYVEGTWPARYHFDDDENSRACTYSPLRPQCPSNEEVDIYGVIPH